MSKSARPAQKKAQRGATKATKKRPKEPSQSGRQEKMSQFTLKMRESLHRELARLAFDSDMTMRGFIMNALRGKGLSVTKTDLVDRRRR
jgi:hypothetical protein